MLGGASHGVLASVALKRPMRSEYTYAVPAGMADDLAVGMRVAVHFGGRREVGIVVDLPSSTDVPASRLKSVSAVLDNEPVLDEDLLQVTRWMGTYYGCSWGEALAAVLPAVLKREGGRRQITRLSPAEGIGALDLATLEDRYEAQHRVLRTLLDAGGPLDRNDLVRKLNISLSPIQTLIKKGWVIAEQADAVTDALSGAPAEHRTEPEELMAQQAAAIEAISKPLKAREFEAFLLRGVTGSGKTEVYLSVIKECLDLGRGAIVLVPEIALTPQTVSWFRSRFGQVAVLHSRMTDAQRHDAWKAVRQREVRVVVGARSALFAPMPDLGVVVVDEEHEPSFKQGSTPRYHGRDLAVVRARQAGAVCILGSATPSLESWENARNGRYTLLEMPERVQGGKLPEVEVIDLNSVKMSGPFSAPLALAIKEAVQRGEQVILFQNRRGFAPVLWCNSCRSVVKCEQCDASMVYHRKLKRIVCHGCCAEQRPPKQCPTCSAPGLRFLGEGSEQVESAVQLLCPDARVARMDSDSMHRQEDYERVLGKFGAREIDILVGTQMIAKGLDFPGVTLVGIVSADSALHLPDFRAAERTFQLLCQVSGRAGRGDLSGRILVQTHFPNHPAILCAAGHDFPAFASHELPLREELSYPPYGRVILVLLDDEDQALVDRIGAHLAEVLDHHLTAELVEILGPAPAPIALLRNRHRRFFLLKTGPRGEGLDRARDLLLDFANKHTRPRITVDVDPVSML
ncbi:MAG: primosomal protein N' [Planctomycetes bacterium]|nr:primosomal protein N' [Planctomycetota bacterium]